MQYVVGIVGLVFNLIGAVLIALADRRVSRWLDTSVLDVEMNFQNLLEALGRGTSWPFVSGLDEHRELVATSATRVKWWGWLLLILGYALQIVAVLIAWRAD